MPSIDLALDWCHGAISLYSPLTSKSFEVSPPRCISVTKQTLIEVCYWFGLLVHDPMHVAQHRQVCLADAHSLRRAQESGEYLWSKIQQFLVIRRPKPDIPSPKESSSTTHRIDGLSPIRLTILAVRFPGGAVTDSRQEYSVDRRAEISHLSSSETVSTITKGRQSRPLP
jgi:hypothetical protein